MKCGTPVRDYNNIDNNFFMLLGSGTENPRLYP